MSQWLAPPSLAAAFLLSTCSAEAFELTTFVLVQPLAAVVAACGDEGVWGCTTLLPAVDNPADIACFVRIPTTLSLEDRLITEARLRLRCERALAGE